MAEERQTKWLLQKQDFHCSQEMSKLLDIEGVVVQWCNSQTLQPKQSGGVDSKPGRAPQLKRHDKGSLTRLAFSYFCDSSAWR